MRSFTAEHGQPPEAIIAPPMQVRPLSGEHFLRRTLALDPFAADPSIIP
jgi:hypothetical protein